MQSGVRIGKIFGVPIELHFSWFLIFGLFTWSMAGGFFPQAYPDLPAWAFWLMALITSVLFFGSVLVHELGHAWVALRENVPVRRITLFIFGGLAQITQEPKSPGAEFRIAIAGPLASLGLAAFFGALWLLDQAIPYLAAPSMWLARINLILAFFNLIPGFPLDGGRVLRSIIWQRTGSLARATRIATAAGQLVAFGFIGIGVFTILNGEFFSGLWLAFIGWFLQNAATTSASQSSMQEVLRDVRVDQVMQREFSRLPGLLSLRQIVDEHVLTGGQRTFFVAENGDPGGLLTLGDISRIPQRKWAFTRADQAMIPFDRLIHIQAHAPLLEALQKMDQAQVAQVPVLEEDRVVGVLSREDVLHHIRLRSELGI